ncbi:SDR family oxidoreductase [Oceanobacillus piezotolerans]|uniref:SDR family oxidoreductase n=1 Tax=Oceanobacillus piezotolerans TaxID=2448030 RepID=A0A498D7K8_9BACI|nr:SDR family oxidoreductase [Oceanobacillus piezotolerans]RLL43778.1 SDR family oxidoreductase [Oceanobacillus piezotolerans]
MTQVWKDVPEKWAEVIANVPMGIAAKPEDIASMVLYLSSDEARFCNMQVFTVDGGQTSH